MSGGVESIGPCDDPMPSTTFAMSSSEFRAAPKNLAPDFACRLNNEPQFSPLIVFADQISFQRRGEPALRTQRKILKRQLPRSFFDPPDNLVAALELGAF